MKHLLVLASLFTFSVAAQAQLTKAQYDKLLIKHTEIADVKKASYMFNGIEIAYVDPKGVFHLLEAAKKPEAAAWLATVLQSPLKVSVTITLSGSPSEQKAAFEQYAKKYNWSAKVTDSKGLEVDNPESAEEFTVRHLEDHFKAVIDSADQSKAAEDAIKAARDNPRIDPDKKPKPENGGRIR